MHYLPEDRFVVSLGFTKIHNRILDMMPDVGSVAFSVYLQLARHTDKNGHCWPSIRRLARLCAIDEKTAGVALKRLADWKLIDIRKRKGIHNQYWLAPPEECGKPRYTTVGAIPTEQEPLEQGADDHDEP